MAATLQPVKNGQLALRLAPSPGLVALDGLKSDTVFLDETYRGFHVGVAGNMKFDCLDGGAAVTIAVNAGTFYPYTISRLWTTGTTATGIHGVR